MEKEAFELRGKVEAVLIAEHPGSIISARAEKIEVRWSAGIKGDRHSIVRTVDSREKELLSFGIPKRTDIANHREFSALSIEELGEIARAMKLPRQIPYGLLGENIVVGGIPKLTELPTGTMFFFVGKNNEKRSAVLVVWGENTPCLAPGKAIQEQFPEVPNLAKHFPRAAHGKRGVVGSVYCNGEIHEGDAVIAKIPRQKIYDPA